MRSKLLTVWAVVLMGAIGAIVQGRVALMADELDSSPLAKLYTAAGTPSLEPAKMAELRSEAKRLYRTGQCRTSEDLYRLAGMLSSSQDSADLMLAHDCALASLIEGFRPAHKTLRTSQEHLLRSIGHVNHRARLKPSSGSLLKSAPLLKKLEASWSEAMQKQAQAATQSITLPVIQ